MHGSSETPACEKPARLQFGLRGLLTFVTVICVLLGLAHVFGFPLLFFYPFATVLLLLAVGVGLILFLLAVQIPVTWVCSKCFGTPNQIDSELNDSDGTIHQPNESNTKQ